MSRTYNEDVHFAGGISVGNLASGMIVVSPTAGERLTVDITGLNLEGEGELFPQAQVYTQWPWHSCSNATIWTTSDTDALWDDEDATSFRIAFVRTNTASTNIGWMAWRGVT
jgi:hypothetical protein